MYDEEPRTYLYKDGKQNVAWDNSGHKPFATYTSDGGATLNANNMTFDMPQVSKHSRAIVTNNVIDLSDYSTLKVVCNYNNAEHVFTTDISNLLSSYYVAISTIRADSSYYVELCVSSQKDNYAETYVKRDTNIIGNYNVTVSRVWLEK